MRTFLIIGTLLLTFMPALQVFAFDESHLSRVKRTGNCPKCDLGKATLVRADLKGADLSGADLRNADLRETDLSDSDLTGADLRGANLFATDLSRADMSGVNLTDNKSVADSVFCDTITPWGVDESGCPEEM